ncbi:hypothetical protein [Archangium lipolyticum]|uniref:hypothetical protein n=1 Tax=Archangium lipolyticum TaxID=2970465 RepID=UPI002149BB81|nr:hypothetical protein [Archangium lipolyticum]
MGTMWKWGMGAALLGALVGCGTTHSEPPREQTVEEPDEQAGPGEVVPPEPVEDKGATRSRLCGPSTSPCAVTLREKIPLAPSEHVSSLSLPALVLDKDERPHVFAAGQFAPDFGAILAVRSGPGQWDLQRFPSGWAGASFTLSPEGRPLVVGAGPFEQGEPTWLWELESGTWRKKSDIGWGLRSWAHLPVLLGDANGGLHAFLWTNDGTPDLVHASNRGTWKTEMLGSGGRFLLQPGFTLSARGQAQFAYWETHEGRWTLTWQQESSAPERIFSLPCCGDSGGWPGGSTAYTPLLVAMTGGGSEGSPEVPHLFFSRTVSADEPLSELAYATRGPGGGWEVRSLLQDERLSPPSCGDIPPTHPGETCELESITHTPLSIVADSQEVRALVGRNHTRIQLGTNCRRNVCQWESSGYASDFRVELVWLEAGEVRRSEIWRGEEPLRAVTAQADSRGKIHLVAATDIDWVYLIIANP